MKLVMHPNPILNEDMTHLTTTHAEAVSFANEMQLLCHRHKGVGISANQCNMRLNMCIVGVIAKRRGDRPAFHVLANPKIIEERGRMITAKEGCLSLPGRDFITTRRHTVKVEFMNIHGVTQRMSFSAIGARCFLHEYDLLRGLTLVETGREITKPKPEIKDKMKDKTLENSDVSRARKNVPDLKVVGNGDSFQLLCKASSQEEGWMKSTKAMQVETGCIVQVTTQQRNPDGSYAVAEALTFVPGVKIQNDENNGRMLVG